MAFTALAMVAMMGIMTLAIDIGFDAGQRRFMQNGADAAALAVADQLAGAVSPYPKSHTGIPQYFDVTDADVRSKATDIAQRNQNAGLTGRTTSFTVLVEYCVASGPSNYIAGNGCPGGNTWVPSPTADGRVPDGTYKVRVTVTSTITTLFGRVIGKGSMTTNGQAIALIRGICPPTTVTGNTWPMTIWNQQDFFTNPGQLFQLWASNPPAPQHSNNAWKNVIDFTPPSRWCDGVTADYPWAANHTWAGLVPSGTVCTNEPAYGNYSGTSTTWNNAAYTPDSRGGCYVGQSTAPANLATWISTGYSGTLALNMKVPLFPQTGDWGNNISNAILGTTPDPCSGTWFFNGVTAQDPDHTDWGVYRDVIIFTYDIPGPNNTPATASVGGHYYDSNNPAAGWSDSFQGNNVVGRVTLVAAYNFRIYSHIPGTNASSIWGRVESPVIPPSSNPPLCGTGPGIYGNVTGLGS